MLGKQHSKHKVIYHETHFVEVKLRGRPQLKLVWAQMDMQGQSPALMTVVMDMPGQAPVIVICFSDLQRIVYSSMHTTTSE